MLRSGGFGLLNNGRIRTWFSEKKTTECFYVCGQIIETLRSRFLGISHKPRTSGSHVTKALPSGVRFEVHVCTAEPRTRGKWFTVRFFLHLKTSESHVWEEILLFRTISLINYRILFYRNVIFKTISRLKLMKTNMAAAGYHPNMGRLLMRNRWPQTPPRNAVCRLRKVGQTSI